MVQRMIRVSLVGYVSAAAERGQLCEGMVAGSPR
jgi:hypothetical protein